MHIFKLNSCATSNWLHNSIAINNVQIIKKYNQVNHNQVSSFNARLYGIKPFPKVKHASWVKLLNSQEKMLKKIQLQVSTFHWLKTNCWSQVINKYKLCCISQSLLHRIITNELQSVTTEECNNALCQ